MKRLEKQFVKAAGLLSTGLKVIGVYTFLRELQKKRVIVLMYHGITRQHNPLSNFDQKHVQHEKFEEQMKYLVQHYNLISLKDFMLWKQGEKKLPPKALLLTFDDGYRNVYTQLFPLFKKYQLPVTIFLPTQYLGKKGIGWYDIIPYCISKTNKKEMIVCDKKYNLCTEKDKISAILQLKIKARDHLLLQKKILDDVIKQTDTNPRKCSDDDFLYLSWKQCQEMQSSGAVFGSHSVTHQVMTMLNEDGIRNEMQKSKEKIEHELGGICVSFAYPFGDNNTVTRRILKQIGYRAGFSTRYGKNVKETEIFQLRRISVSNKYNLSIFILTLFFNFSSFHHGLIKLYAGVKNLIFPQPKV